MIFRGRGARVARLASLAVRAVVTWGLARAAPIDMLAIGLMFVSAALLLRYKINSAWLVLGGGVLGNILQWTR